MRQSRPKEILGILSGWGDGFGGGSLGCLFGIGKMVDRFLCSTETQIRLSQPGWGNQCTQLHNLLHRCDLEVSEESILISFNLSLEFWKRTTALCYGLLMLYVSST